MLNQEPRRSRVLRGIVRGGRPKPVDVPVEHAERRRDQHGVMDLQVGRARGPRFRDGLSSDHAPAHLHQACDLEQRSELGRNRGGAQVGERLLDLRHASRQLRRRGSAVRARAVDAVVPFRHVGRDQLALAAGERVVTAQQNLGELRQRPGGLRPVGEQRADARMVIAPVDVRHKAKRRTRELTDRPGLVVLRRPGVGPQETGDVIGDVLDVPAQPVQLEELRQRRHAGRRRVGVQNGSVAGIEIPQVAFGGATPAVSQSMSRQPAAVSIVFPGCGSPWVSTARSA